jgi:hypothetical protein
VALCGYHWHQSSGAATAVSKSRMYLSNVLCLCPQGTFCPEGSSLGCVPTSCDTSGHYCPKGSTSSEPCPEGGHCPDTSTFVPCGIGAFSAETWQVTAAACTDCPEIPGNLCPLGSAAPVLCPPGDYCPDTATAVPCAAGTFSAAAGQSSNETVRPSFLPSFLPSVLDSFLPSLMFFSISFLPSLLP